MDERNPETLPAVTLLATGRMRIAADTILLRISHTGMNYADALSYLMIQLPMYQRIGAVAYKSGLDNTYRLDEYFMHPHRQFKTIHVAGTNGKGSVSHMLASILQEAGYRVGLYTSPHLLDFRERIKVSGRMIPKNEVTRFVKNHRAFFDSFQPSFFEISVFMAFEYFARQKVDVAVVEVGLGGRLDSTNIITPLLSVITNIGRDHMELLGDTPNKIASEKAGIIKPGVPVVIGESQQETREVFRQTAALRNAPIRFADEILAIDDSRMMHNGLQLFRVRKGNQIIHTDLACELLGHYQRKNILTVLVAAGMIKDLGFPHEERDLYAGIAKVVTNTGLHGRWQVISDEPKVICDTAHNADGIKAVMNQAAETPCRNLHVVIGFVNDKDLEGIFSYLPVNARYYFSRLSVPRTMNENDLASFAARHNIQGEAYTSVIEAFSAARASASAADLILITGSTFLVADFLASRK